MDENGAPVEEESTEVLGSLEKPGSSCPLSGQRPSVDPPPAPPPFPAAHAPLPSKRRWTPSTWRYAIEESQPELASRPRHGNSSSNANSASAAAAASRESRRKAAAENTGPDRIPARVSPNRAGNHQHHHYYNEQQAWVQQQREEEAYRRGALQRRREAEEERMGGGRRREDNGGQQEQQREQALEIPLVKRRSPAMKAMEEAEGEAGHVWTPAEEVSGRRKREMTPSELYFCQICGVKEGNGSNEDVGDHDHSCSR